MAPPRGAVRRPRIRPRMLLPRWCNSCDFSGNATPVTSPVFTPFAPPYTKIPNPFGLGDIRPLEFWLRRRRQWRQSLPSLSYLFKKFLLYLSCYCFFFPFLAGSNATMAGMLTLLAIVRRCCCSLAVEASASTRYNWSLMLQPCLLVEVEKSKTYFTRLG